MSHSGCEKDSGKEEENTNISNGACGGSNSNHPQILSIILAAAANVRDHTRCSEPPLADLMFSTCHPDVSFDFQETSHHE
ncbi:hypothetical protein ACOMHN_008340 [Nucella lapillus]